MIHESCRSPNYEAVVARLERRKTRRNELTAERLRELLHYDPKTGVFTWLVRPSQSVAVGSVAGTIDFSVGYRRIGIGGVIYLASRLAWLYMTGEWPKCEIDHRNLNRLDNSWDNLRAATDSENQHNKPRQRNNTSGFKGVSPRGNVWIASITVGWKPIYLGLFNTPEEAHAAYREAAERLHGDFARVA